MGFIARCRAGHKLQLLDAWIWWIALCVELKYITDLPRGREKERNVWENINLNFQFQHFSCWSVERRAAPWGLLVSWVTRGLSNLMRARNHDLSFSKPRRDWLLHFNFNLSDCFPVLNVTQIQKRPKSSELLLVHFTFTYFVPSISIFRLYDGLVNRSRL
jgi:hypothetical protein